MRSHSILARHLLPQLRDPSYNVMAQMETASPFRIRLHPHDAIVGNGHGAALLALGKTRPAKATADQPIEDRVLSANLRALYKAVLNLLGHAAYCKLGH